MKIENTDCVDAMNAVTEFESEIDKIINEPVVFSFYEYSMKIIYTDITLENQIELSPEWFADFNWQNFKQGETVWMEDNLETNKPAALFCGIKNNTVFLYGVGYKIAYLNQVVN